MFESHIQSQVDNGRTATTVGFTGAFQDYQNNKNLLDAEIDKIKNSNLSQQEQEAQASTLLNQFQEVYGFVPSSYNVNTQ